MQGPEKELRQTYVASGQLRIIFWPMLDLGRSSRDAAAAIYCAGQQSPEHFWSLHDLLFADQDTYSGDRDYFISQATAIGADPGAFTTCFDAGEMHTLVRELDQERRDNSILRRPTFDINGIQLFGSVPFTTFEEAILAALPE